MTRYNITRALCASLLLLAGMTLAQAPAFAAGDDDHSHGHEEAAGHDGHSGGHEGHSDGHNDQAASGHDGHSGGHDQGHGDGHGDMQQDGHAHGHGDARQTPGASQLRAGNRLIDSRDLYLSNCASCHGKRGQGTAEVPRDFSDPTALVDLTRERMGSALLGETHSGIAGNLGEEEREAVIGYLRNFLMLPAPAADTGVGRSIYARSCSVCHGDRGDGTSWAQNSLDPAPASFTDHALGELTRPQMIEAVTFGKENSAMMAFAVQLTNEEIAATVDYIREAFMTEEGSGKQMPGHDHDHGDQHAAAGDVPFPHGLTGDPAWGEKFYNENCAECHGEKGDGQGRRAYFMIVKPKNFLGREARAELNREELFEYISEGVNGTTMPAWEKVLSAQEMANVGEYVYRTFLRPEEFGTMASPAPTWKPAGTVETEQKKN